MSRLAIYAVVAAEPAAALGTGAAGEPLVAIPAGGSWRGLGAIAGEQAAPPTIAHETLAAHARVVERLAAAHDPLLPVRFGEAAASADDLAARLDERREELVAALALVTGGVQMTLRIFGDPRPAGPDDGDPRDDAPGLSAGGPGARHLAALRRRHERARELPEIAEIRARLRPLLLAERVVRHDRPGLVASAYDLVPRERVDEYLETLREARAAGAAPGFRVTSSGPWPPWAYAPRAGR